MIPAGDGVRIRPPGAPAAAFGLPRQADSARLPRMPIPPVTSMRLLRDIASDRDSLRWNDFVARYRPMMLAFVEQRFPYLADEADDLVQETLLVLMEKLPDYRYDPEELGSFHNYLTGILRNRACRAIRRRTKHARDVEAAAESLAVSGETTPPDDPAREESGWRAAVCDIALRQLLADPSIQERTKEVFRRTVVAGESPAAVAEAFGMERNAVDQIKNRLLRRMRETVAALVAADEAE